MTSETLWLVCGCFFAGFIDSIAGGGGLISLPLLLHLGLGPKFAIGSNKLIGIAAATASTLRYAVSGHIDIKKVKHAALGGLLGGWVGAYCVSIVSSEFLMPVIICGLLIAALLSLKKNYFMDASLEKNLSILGYFLIGLSLGFYDGFFGPGTGSFLMIAFVSFAGMSVLQASASARMVNFATNLAALSLFSLKGLVDFRFALLGMASSACGAALGANLSIARGSKLIRPVYMIVVWGMILKLIYNWLTP